nr:uncharacterized protein LOC109193917 [Ipomoea trifida]
MLWEKVEQLRYKKEGCRCFAKTDSELIERVLDLEAWNLVNSIVRPKVLEIWVIVGVVGEHERSVVEIVAFEIDEAVVGEVESTDEEYDSGDNLEDELDKFEDSDYEIEQAANDDSEFVKFIDPEVEYAGGGNVEIPTTQVAEQFPTNSEVDLSDAKDDFKIAVKTYAIQYGKELKFKKNDKRWKAQIVGNSNWKMKEFRETVCTGGHHSLTKRQAYKAMEFAKQEIKGLKADNNQHEGMKLTSHGVRISYDQPPKRRKTIVHGSKRNQVDETNPPSNAARAPKAKTHKSLRMTKSRIVIGRKYKTRSTVMFKSKHGGNIVAWSSPVEDEVNGGKSCIAVGEHNVGEDGGFDWLDEDGDLVLNWDDVVDVNVENAVEQVKGDELRNIGSSSDIGGCHLKGFQKGGQLLAAVGVDISNCINPYDLTFISDKQKGLVEAVEEVLKRVFWAACKATTQPEFNQHIEAMQVLNPKAAECVSERSPHHICRDFFDSSTKSDMLLNNLCESFNSSILNARDKHNVTMVKCLRIYLMKRMQHNRDKMRNNPIKICPKIVH